MQIFVVIIIIISYFLSLSSSPVSALSSHIWGQNWNHCPASAVVCNVTSYIYPNQMDGVLEGQMEELLHGVELLKFYTYIRYIGTLLRVSHSHLRELFQMIYFKILMRPVYVMYTAHLFSSVQSVGYILNGCGLKLNPADPFKNQIFMVKFQRNPFISFGTEIFVYRWTQRP
jgi:hypothetical protein